MAEGVVGTIFTEETGIVGSPIAAGLPEDDMVSDLPGNRGTVFANSESNLFKRALLRKHVGNGDSVIE